MSSGERRVAVVTGASSGIGRAVAVRFAKEGWRVALAARSEDALRESARAVEAAGGEALVVPTDVTDAAAVEALARAVRERWARCDVLVNNAGVGFYGLVADMDLADWEAQIRTNLTGPFLVSKAFLPLVLETPGTRSILNVASVSGLEGQPGLSAYCASKFGLRGFTRSLAAEVSDAGVRVLNVNPGYVATPMGEGGSVKGEDMVQPEDLADLLHYLATCPPSMQLEDVTVWPQRLFSS